MRKYIVIGSIIVIIVGISFLISFFASRPQEPAPTGTTPLTETTNAPITTATSNTANAAVIAVSQDPVMQFWIYNNAVYAINEAGQILYIKNDQQSELVNSQTLDGVRNIEAAPDGSAIIAEFNYPAQPHFGIFNLSNSTWQTLPSTAQAAAWSPDSKRIAYLDVAAAGSNLKILTRATSKTQTVTSMAFTDTNLRWLSEDSIYLQVNSPSVTTESSVWRYSFKQNTFTLIIKDEAGLVITWPNQEGIGLKLQSISQKPQLELIDQSFNSLLRFSFLTVPEKCAFQGVKAFCAVPRSISPDIKLPDDFYKRSVNFEDDFYQFDFSNGSIRSILKNTAPSLNAVFPQIFNSSLLFINRYDNRLYKINL